MNFDRHSFTESHRLLLQELIDVEGDGMADMVFRCIQEMDIDNRMMVWLLCKELSYESLVSYSTTYGIICFKISGSYHYRGNFRMICN